MASEMRQLQKSFVSLQGAHAKCDDTLLAFQRKMGDFASTKLELEASRMLVHGLREKEAQLNRTVTRHVQEKSLIQTKLEGKMSKLSQELNTAKITHAHALCMQKEETQHREETLTTQLREEEERFMQARAGMQEVIRKKDKQNRELVSGQAEMQGMVLEVSTQLAVIDEKMKEEAAKYTELKTKCLALEVERNELLSEARLSTSKKHKLEEEERAREFKVREEERKKNYAEMKKERDGKKALQKQLDQQEQELQKREKGMNDKDKMIMHLQIEKIKVRKDLLKYHHRHHRIASLVKQAAALRERMRIHLGVMFVPCTKGRGVRVTRAQARQPVHTSGIREGDIITAVQGMSVNDTKEFYESFHHCAAGDTVELTTLRNQKIVTRRVVVGVKSRPMEEVAALTAFVKRNSEEGKEEQVAYIMNTFDIAPTPPPAYDEITGAKEHMEEYVAELQSAQQHLQLDEREGWVSAAAAAVQTTLAAAVMPERTDAMANTESDSSSTSVATPPLSSAGAMGAANYGNDSSIGQKNDDISNATRTQRIFPQPNLAETQSKRPLSTTKSSTDASGIIRPQPSLLSAPASSPISPSKLLARGSDHEEAEREWKAIESIRRGNAPIPPSTARIGDRPTNAPPTPPSSASQPAALPASSSAGQPLTTSAHAPTPSTPAAGHVMSRGSIIELTKKQAMTSELLGLTRRLRRGSTEVNHIAQRLDRLKRLSNRHLHQIHRGDSNEYNTNSDNSNEKKSDNEGEGEGQTEGQGRGNGKAKTKEHVVERGYGGEGMDHETLMRKLRVLTNISMNTITTRMKRESAQPIGGNGVSRDNRKADDEGEHMRDNYSKSSAHKHTRHSNTTNKNHNHKINDIPKNAQVKDASTGSHHRIHRSSDSGNTKTGENAGAVETLRRSLDRLQRQRNTQRSVINQCARMYSEMQPVIGLAFVDVPEHVLVTHVSPDGPAASAGILLGDFITQINRAKIQNKAMVLDALRELRPGDIVPVMVLRDGSAKLLMLKMGGKGYTYAQLDLIRTMALRKDSERELMHTHQMLALMDREDRGGVSRNQPVHQ